MHRVDSTAHAYTLFNGLKKTDFGRPFLKTVRHMLSDHCLSSPVCV